MNSKKSFIVKLSGCLLVSMPGLLFAQDTTAIEPAKPSVEYVKSTFENAIVIDNQTVESMRKNSLEFIIQHRFGIIDNADDLFGFYAPANIKLGLNYSITDRFSLGLGVTKNKMIYELQGKYVLLKQTKGKGTPVSLAYFVDVGKSTLDDENFTNAEGGFKEAYKYSYFHELMVARKFNSKIAAQLAATYSHYNIIDSAYGKHDFFGVSFVGKYKFSPQSSVLLNFDYLLNVSDMNEDDMPKPNLGIGYEVSTGSHQFQIFVTSSDNIVNQEYRVYNKNDFFAGDILFGFNITRQWGF